MQEQEKARKSRLLGAVIWPSFLCAGFASMIFFSMFDPLTLAEATTWRIALSRLGGYTIGFFLFWFLTASSSALTIFLLTQSYSDDK